MTENLKPTEATNPRCSFFVIRKKRFCKMLVSKGKKFCGQHLTNEVGNNVQHKRIPCPLDPKHSCFEHKLQQHLQICNAREKTGIPYQSLGINLGEEDGDISKTSLRDLDDSELIDFIHKVQRIHEEYVCQIKERIGNHPALNDAVAREDFGPSVIRHLRQNSSLLRFMEENGLISDAPKVYIEFGAGRGQLTGWLIKALKETKGSTFLLVDKGAQRYKVETKLKYAEDLKIRRIRLDIQDLNLDCVEEVCDNSDIVACGKHLCGAATDFSLRCLVQSQKGRKGGIVIALCCHHRCSWRAYTGKEFFKAVGLRNQDFPVLCSLSSWAVSGSRQSSNSEHEPTNDGVESKLEDQKGENRYKKLELSVDYREEIGRKAKQIIDMGRVKYLEKFHHMEASLIQYVDKSSTLENIALVAVSRSSV